MLQTSRQPAPCTPLLRRCVEAQTLVDLHVDTAALRALLASRLPLLRGGARVAEAALPWPSIAVGDAAPRQRQPVGRLFGTRPQAPLPAADAVWAPVEQALPCWA